MTAAIGCPVSRLIAGHCLAYCLIWLCWALAAPIVAEAARVEPKPDAICPWLQIRHGVGSDLKTYIRVRDLCQS